MTPSRTVILVLTREEAGLLSEALMNRHDDWREACRAGDDVGDFSDMLSFSRQMRRIRHRLVRASAEATP